MKKTFFLLWALLLCNAVSMNAQVRIGGDTMPHAAAVLDLNANNDSLPAGNRGALALPRVSLASTTAQLNNTVPANGMMVYNTGGALSAGIYSWNGTQWLKVQDNSNSVTNTIAPLITWVPVVFGRGSGPGMGLALPASIPSSTGLSVFGSDTCALVRGLVDAILWDPASSASRPVRCVVTTADFSGLPGAEPPVPNLPSGSCVLIVNEISNTIQPWSWTGMYGIDGYPISAATPCFLPYVYWKKAQN